MYNWQCNKLSNWRILLKKILKLFKENILINQCDKMSDSGGAIPMTEAVPSSSIIPVSVHICLIAPSVILTFLADAERDEKNDNGSVNLDVNINFWYTYNRKCK